MIKKNPNLEKRFGEVEDSVKAIAGFVKQQTEKNKEMLEEIKGSIKMPKIDTGRFDSKIASIEKEMDELRLARKPIDTDKIKSSMDVLEEKINEIDSKLSGFARKEDIKNIGIAPKYIDDKISMEIGQRLNDQGRLVLADFERRIRALKSEFERDIESRVEKSLGDEADILRNEFDRKLNELKAGSGSSKDYEHFYDDMRKTNARIIDIENRLKMHKTGKEIDDKLTITEKKIREAGSSELREFENRLARIKNEMDTFATKNDIDALKRMLAGQNINQKMLEDTESLRTNFEEQTMLHASADKRISDLENEIRAFKKSIKEQNMNDKLNRDINLLKAMSEEQAAIHKSMDKRMQNVEREMQKTYMAENAEEKADVRNIADRLSQISNLLDDERSKRANLVNNVHELENEMNDIRKEKSKSLIDKEVEDKLNREIVKHMSEFAKAMDKRLPSIVSREEYMSFIKDVDNRLRNVESPDLTHLFQRIEMLEQKISQINTMTKDIYNRIPIIVE